MKSSGYVYILTNEHMPGLVKIGFTDRDPATRALELSGHTGVPGKFMVHTSWEVENAAIIEKRIFAAIAKQRVDGEFFRFADPKECTNTLLKLLKSWSELDENGQSVPARVRDQRRLEQETILKKVLEERKARAIIEWRKIEELCKKNAFIVVTGGTFDVMRHVDTRYSNRLVDLERSLSELEVKLGSGKVAGAISRYFSGTYSEQIAKAKKEIDDIWSGAAYWLLHAMYKHFKKFDMLPPQEIAWLKHRSTKNQHGESYSISVGGTRDECVRFVGTKIDTIHRQRSFSGAEVAEAGYWWKRP